MEDNNFKVILIGIIYNPEKKKILIGKGNLDPNSMTGWCFPGARLKKNEELDKKLKLKIKEQTGYEIKNLGSIFVRVPIKEPDSFTVFFLCEKFSGKEKAGDGIEELKWIDPNKELEKYFPPNMNTRLKEYLENLGSSDVC
jgi:ADP-ribose pyrophosphatase YjhB (NUDIX family)